MKKVIYILIIPALLSLALCTKKTRGKMTVVRDCTGMYLRFEGKDYHVCNEESFSSIADGTRVTATFEKTGSCKPIEDRVVCKLLHLNEGYVKVKKLKIK